MTRLIEAHDLELYAINTSAFYETHKQLVIRPVEEWQVHLLKTVLPHYCREIEPVKVDAPTLKTVAASLLAYYQRHQHEWAATVMAQVKRERTPEPSNVVPISREKMVTMQQTLMAVVGPQLAVLIGNPVEGFAVIGPFDTGAAANLFLDHIDTEGWVVPIHVPALPH